MVQRLFDKSVAIDRISFEANAPTLDATMRFAVVKESSRRDNQLPQRRL
jgi:hypothetical protein